MQRRAAASFEHVDDEVGGTAHNDERGADGRIDDIFLEDLDGSTLHVRHLLSGQVVAERSCHGDSDEQAVRGNHNSQAERVAHDVALGDSGSSEASAAPGIPINVKEVARGEDNDVAAAVEARVLQRIGHFQLLAAALLVVFEPFFDVRFVRRVRLVDSLKSAHGLVQVDV